VTSLRSRLILGSALVALVPLAVSMFLLARRIESMVRAQAAERLTSALTSLEGELASSYDQAVVKLAILAKDPTLRRLYLVRPSGSQDLSEYVAERRVLLGLDFLHVTDASGRTIAEAAAPESRSGFPLIAAAPVLYEGQPAGTLQGGILLDAPLLSRLARATGMAIVLRDPAGAVVASSPGVAVVPSLEQGARVARVEGIFFVLGTKGRPAYLGRRIPLEVGPAPHATITGLISTKEADAAVTSLQVTSTWLGFAGVLLAVLLGMLWSDQISRPVEALAAYSRRLAQGRWDEPPEIRSVREIGTLVDALDRMRTDLVAYRDRLVTSERQAAWSQMARKVAHEVKNPLTPIAVSIEDLKRSYEQKREDFPAILDQAVRTVLEEVSALKGMLQEFADFARLPAPRFEPFPVSGLLSDLAALYGRDVAEGRLRVEPPGLDATLSADRGQLRQALVNLVQNGLEASGGCVKVTSSAEPERITIRVADDGPGLSAAQREQLFTPGFTTKAHGSGLGLTIVQRIVSDHGGAIRVEDGAPRGTVFSIELPLHGKEEHADAAPR